MDILDYARSQRIGGRDGELIGDLCSEVETLRTALEAVKTWDIGHALDGLTAGDGTRFTLPRDLRKLVQDALASSHHPDVGNFVSHCGRNGRL